jgi:hypothetical protein
MEENKTNGLGLIKVLLIVLIVTTAGTGVLVGMVMKQWSPVAEYYKEMIEDEKAYEEAYGSESLYDDALVDEDVYYDKDGNVIEYDDEGNPVVYDDEGNATPYKGTIYDVNGDPVEDEDADAGSATDDADASTAAAVED